MEILKTSQWVWDQNMKGKQSNYLKQIKEVEGKAQKPQKGKGRKKGK